MNASRRSFLATLAAGLATWRCSSPSVEDDGITRYVRYEHQGKVAHGILQAETVQPIEGDLFGARTPAGDAIPAGEVKLLYPTQPRKILALAGNYRSHIGDETPPPQNPEPAPESATTWIPGSRLARSTQLASSCGISSVIPLPRSGLSRVILAIRPSAS